MAEALYKYPQAAFPYERLVADNKARNRDQPEFEPSHEESVFDRRPVRGPGLSGSNGAKQAILMSFLLRDVVFDEFVRVVIELRRDRLAYVAHGPDAFIFVQHCRLPVAPVASPAPGR